MNIMARLRKLGYERCGPLFRSIDIDRHQASLSAIAIPGMRPLMPKRPLDAQPSGRSPSLRTVLDNEPGPARSTLVRRRSLAPEQHRPTPFVGRKAELRRLLDARSRAAAGHGQVVLLSGDAGVGKSRLVRELRPSQPHTVLWHRCSPEHAFRPLHPVIGLLQELPGLPEAEKEASGRQPGLTPQRLRVADLREPAGTNRAARSSGQHASKAQIRCPHEIRPPQPRLPRRGPCFTRSRRSITGDR